MKSQRRGWHDPIPCPASRARRTTGLTDAPVLSRAWLSAAHRAYALRRASAHEREREGQGQGGPLRWELASPQPAAHRRGALVPPLRRTLQSTGGRALYRPPPITSAMHRSIDAATRRSRQSAGHGCERGSLDVRPVMTPHGDRVGGTLPSKMDAIRTNTPVIGIVRKKRVLRPGGCPRDRQFPVRRAGCR